MSAETIEKGKFASGLRLEAGENIRYHRAVVPTSNGDIVLEREDYVQGHVRWPGEVIFNFTGTVMGVEQNNGRLNIYLRDGTESGRDSIGNPFQIGGSQHIEEVVIKKYGKRDIDR